MKKAIITLLLLSQVVLGKTKGEIDRDIEKLFSITSKTQQLQIKYDIVNVDLERLMRLTTMIESRYGTNTYKGRIAKSPFQYELDTARHYISVVPELKSFLECELGRQINVDNEDDCVYITYLIYMSKIRHHKNWLDKFYNKYYKNSKDAEWLVYKVLYNSIKGASTYKKWKQREIELILMEV